MGGDERITWGHRGLFGALIVFGIIELAITGFVTGRYNGRHDYPNTSVRDRVKYLLFCSIWTVLFSILYVALFSHSASGSIATSVLSHGIWIFLTWIFWTAGAAAITASFHGANNCSKLQYDLAYCNQLNAALGFAWVEWLFSTILLFSIIALAIRATRRGDGLSSQLVA